MCRKEVLTFEPQKPSLLINDCSSVIDVCAYCRVSTDKNNQANSFKAQCDFFKREFINHQNWKERTIFADEGISGTSYKKRDEFNRMIHLAKQGKYQLIVTKGVSRFSRNVLDILQFVEELRKRKVYIWFMTENIYTEEQNYREQLIKASELAESESRNTSVRVKWGQRYKMKQGVVFGRKEMFGYSIIKDNNGNDFFAIIPEEAEIVKRIFNMYAEGIGTFKIAKALNHDGVKTKRLKSSWSNTVILRMLRNERYVGDLLQGKTYTPDFLTHEKKYNHGESATYFIKDDHCGQAIISRELWNKVQLNLKNNQLSNDTKKKHSNRYWCSGKIFCGECGERFISCSKKLKSGGIYKSWKCWESQQRGNKKTVVLENGNTVQHGCNSHSVNEKVLKQGIYDILEIILKPEMESNYQTIKDLIIRNDINQNDDSFIEKLTTSLNAKSCELTNLTRKYTSGDISQIAYNTTSKAIESEMQSINNKIAIHSKSKSKSKSKNAEEADGGNLEIKQQLNTIKSILEFKNSEITEDLYRSVVDKILVFNNNILHFYFLECKNPIVMKYKTFGKMDNYQVSFEIISA